jgi:hypothetical protein
MTARERVLLWVGAIVIIVSFTLDWTRTDGPVLWTNIAEGRHLLHGLDTYVPSNFPWPVFVAGEALGLASWVSYTRRLGVSREGPFARGEAVSVPLTVD